MPPGNYSGIGGRLGPASANLNTNLQPIVDGTQAGPVRRPPYAPNIQRPVTPTAKPPAGVPAGPNLFGLAGQVTVYTPLVHGALQKAQEVLNSPRGQAFKQNMNSGNYGQALRHLTGQYADTSKGLRFEVDPGALNRRPTQQRQTVKKSGRLDDPIAGKGPQSNQVGSEVDQSTWKKQSTQEESLEPGEKINENGIKQKGRDLSSSTLGRQLLLELPEGPDANSFIQSEGPTPAPGAGLNLNMPGVSAESFYKQPPVPFQIADEAGPKFAMEMSPESLKASENAFSTDMTKYTPLLTNIQETEAKKEEPKPSRQRGSARQQEFAARPGNQPFGGEEPATADLVSPMYANAARNAARSGFLDAPISEGPMGRIRRKNAAVGLNAAGNIAKIDGKLYNVTKDQAYALTGGAGNTREGLDAIKNAATLYEAPGTQSMKVDTSNLAPGAKAAVDLAKTKFNQTMGVVPEAVQIAVASATDTSEPVIGETLATPGDAFKRAYMQLMSKKM